MSGENFDIFISYRRSDGKNMARTITETLKGKNYRCFLDFDRLKGGKFDDKIQQAIKDAPIFIAVMTPHYLVRQKKDKEEENQNEDWVYKEIEFAIKNDKYIITINCNGQIKSIPNEVPPNISQALSAHTFAVVYDEQTYESNMEDLIKDWISEVLPPPTLMTEGKANIEVYSDCDCNILKANAVIATVPKDGCSIIKLKNGNHRIICQSSEFPDIEVKLVIQISEGLEEDYKEVKLADRVKERHKQIIEEKRLEELLKKPFKLIQTLCEHKGFVNSALYSPDGKRIVLASTDGTIKILDSVSGKCLQTLEGHNATVFSASYSPDGKRIVSASRAGTIKIWDSASGECLQTLKGHNSSVKSAVYSPDCKRIVSVSRAGTIKIWDSASGECLQTLKGHNCSVKSAVYSPDGKRIVSASYYRTIKIFDSASGECLQTLKGHNYGVSLALYSPDGKRIVSASTDGTIKIWDSASGKCLQTLEGHSGYILSVAYSPDGTKIISSSFDSTIKIWGVE